MPELACRFCGSPLRCSFCDLGMSPLSNEYLESHQLQDMEKFYPLHAYVCEKCFLVQLPEFETPDAIFSQYAYFSSYSDSWLRHAREYADHVTERFKLSHASLVVEIGSNDGYLLKNFVSRDIPVLGVEPAENVAVVARESGVPTISEFFGRAMAERLVNEDRMADLLLGNNVLAHVPDVNDLVGGLKILLKESGVITMEFPYLARLIEQKQFDTIYHEHFSYFSFSTVEQIFRSHGLVLFDVEELPTHGGSIRIFARHQEDSTRGISERVVAMKESELKKGLLGMDTYLGFGEEVKAVKRDILDFLIRAKRDGKSIAGYGAPAKGNTLLNYCGIRSDFIEFTVDRSPYKQNKYLPGTHIPVFSPEKLRERRPDFVFILPWNLKEEVMDQMKCIRDWGGRFVIPIPGIEVVS